MMKRILRTRLSKTTLLAFATFLFIVPAASAMPVISDPGATGAPISAHAVPLTDGWYSAAVQATSDQPLRDGWYPAAVQATSDQPLRDGWYPAAVQATRAATPASSGSGFDYRNAFIAFAIALLLTSVMATAVVKTRRDRHVPVLQ